MLDARILRSACALTAWSGMRCGSSTAALLATWTRSQCGATSCCLARPMPRWTKFPRPASAASAAACGLKSGTAMTAGDVGRMVTGMGPTVTVTGRIVMSRMVAMRRCGWMAVRILPSASALSAGFWTLRRWCTDARLGVRMVQGSTGAGTCRKGWLAIAPGAAVA